MNIYLIIQLLQ